MRSGKSIASWVYDIATARTTITNVIARIQYNRITIMPNRMNGTITNKEGS